MDADKILKIWADCGWAVNDGNAIKFARRIIAETQFDLDAYERLCQAKDARIKELEAALCASSDVGKPLFYLSSRHVLHMDKSDDGRSYYLQYRREPEGVFDFPVFAPLKHS